MEANPLGWFQMGANIVARGQDQRLQRQQLKAQESDRAIRERMLAAQIAQTELENQKFKAEIEARAKADTEWLDINTAISKQQAVLNTAQALGVPTPQFDPTTALDDAAMRLAGSNPNAQKYLAGRVQVENFRADAAKRQQEAEALKFRPSGMIDPVTKAPIVQEAPGKWQAFAPPQQQDSTQPEIRSITDPSTGKAVKLLRTGPNTWKEMEDPAAAKPSNFGQMIAERQAALAKGDTETVRLYDEHFAGKGFQLQFDDQGRVIGMSEGPIKTAQTPQAMVSRLTERMNQSLSAVSELTELQTSIRSKDVGIRGAAGEFWLDKVAPMLGITFVGDPKRIANREKIRLVGEGLLRDISGDTRFSNTDRAAVKKALPSTDWVESKQNIQEASEVIKHMLAKRTVLDSIDLKQPPPKWAFDVMPDPAIRSLVEMDVITPQMLTGLIESGNIDRQRAVNIYKSLVRPR